jgi:hypothetical protein
LAKIENWIFRTLIKSCTDAPISVYYRVKLHRFRVKLHRLQCEAAPIFKKVAPMKPKNIANDIKWICSLQKHIYKHFQAFKRGFFSTNSNFRAGLIILGQKTQKITMESEIQLDKHLIDDSQNMLEEEEIPDFLVTSHFQTSFSKSIMKKQEAEELENMSDMALICPEFAKVQHESETTMYGNLLTRHEFVDLARLRKLLSWTAHHDPENCTRLLFYHECFADRMERENNHINSPVASIPVQYVFSRGKAEQKIGRIYACTKSFFSETSKYGGLQTFPKKYRGYLADRLYWDIDIQNAHASILMSIMYKLNIPVPFLVEQVVTNRQRLFEDVRQLFRRKKTLNNNSSQQVVAEEEVKSESQPHHAQVKNLLHRLMYGGSLCIWLNDSGMELSDQVFSKDSGMGSDAILTFLSGDAEIPAYILSEESAMGNPKPHLLSELLQFPSRLKSISQRLYNHKLYALLPPKKEIKPTNAS